MRKDIFESQREADQFVHIILDGKIYKEKDEAMKRIIERGLIKKWKLDEIRQTIFDLNITPIAEGMSDEEIIDLQNRIELLEIELKRMQQ